MPREAAPGTSARRENKTSGDFRIKVPIATKTEVKVKEKLD